MGGGNGLSQKRKAERQSLKNRQWRVSICSNHCEQIQWIHSVGCHDWFLKILRMYSVYDVAPTSITNNLITSLWTMVILWSTPNHIPLYTFIYKYHNILRDYQLAMWGFISAIHLWPEEIGSVTIVRWKHHGQYLAGVYSYNNSLISLNKMHVQWASTIGLHHNVWTDTSQLICGALGSESILLNGLWSSWQHWGRE